MNKIQIAASLKRIEKSKTNGFYLESLFEYYHLNIAILRILSLKINPTNPVDQIKTKHLLNQIIKEIEIQKDSRIISKKNLKTVKPWLVKMDEYLKTIKSKQPSNTKDLLMESENVFLILNISLSKA